MTNKTEQQNLDSHHGSSERFYFIKNFRKFVVDR